MSTGIAKRHWLEGWDWKDRVVFGTAALVVALCALALMFHRLWPADWKAEVWSATIASWVQAVGSVVGIFAGVFTVRYQLRAQRREADERAKSQDRLRRSQSQQMLLANIIHGKLALANVKSMLARPAPKWARMINALEGLSASIGYIRSDEYPSPGVAVALKGLQLIMEGQLQLIREAAAYADDSSTGHVVPNLEKLRTRLLEENEGLIGAYERMDKQLTKELRKVATKEEQQELFAALHVIRPPA